MWYHEFTDYPPDEPLRKEPAEVLRDMKGIEMNEIQGFGNSRQAPAKGSPLVESLLSALLPRKKGGEQ